ncbi:unnamed protein product [Amoebophrya sp. A25]|nr:unnamed protein product [Amoebophrya sp. A25]|eukprot:GSA25T00003319001.1
MSLRIATAVWIFTTIRHDKSTRSAALTTTTRQDGEDDEDVRKKMNEYFTKMQAARKANAKSFEYKGKTYVQMKAKTGMIMYKAK